MNIRETHIRQPVSAAESAFENIIDKIYYMAEMSDSSSNTIQCLHALTNITQCSHPFSNKIECFHAFRSIVEGDHAFRNTLHVCMHCSNT